MLSFRVLLVLCLASVTLAAYPWTSFSQSYAATIGNATVIFGYKQETETSFRMMIKYTGPELAPSSSQADPQLALGCIMVAFSPKQLTPAKDSWADADLLLLEIPTVNRFLTVWDPADYLRDYSVKAGSSSTSVGIVNQKGTPGDYSSREVQNFKTAPAVGADKAYHLDATAGRFQLGVELVRNYAGDISDGDFDKTIVKGQDIAFNIYAVSNRCPSIFGDFPMPFSSIFASDKLKKFTANAGPSAGTGAEDNQNPGQGSSGFISLAGFFLFAFSAAGLLC